MRCHVPHTKCRLILLRFTIGGDSHQNLIYWFHYTPSHPAQIKIPATHPPRKPQLNNTNKKENNNVEIESVADCFVSSVVVVVGSSDVGWSVVEDF